MYYPFNTLEDEVEEWYRELISGNQNQARESLKRVTLLNSEPFYCCLGVLCERVLDITIPASDDLGTLHDVFGEGYNHNEANPHRLIGSHIRDRLPETFFQELNDKLQLSLQGIGRFIENNKETILAIAHSHMVMLNKEKELKNLFLLYTRKNLDIN